MNEKVQQAIVNISTFGITEPTRINYLQGGYKSASVVLSSGEYDVQDKAIRGKDVDGLVRYIPVRNIQSIG